VVLRGDPDNQSKDWVHFKLVVDQEKEKEREKNLNYYKAKLQEIMFEPGVSFKLTLDFVDSTDLEKAPTSQKVKKVVDDRH